MAVLLGKVAIVTGASSGIGYSTSKLFAREGAKVIVSARREAKLNTLVEEIRDNGGEAVALTGDVKDEKYLQSLVELACRQYGGLDIAFNNAGVIGTTGATSELLLSDWEETISVNLTSAFLAAKCQLPIMLERGAGSLIFTSSFAGYTVGFPEMAAYCASKAGLIGLTKSIAVEFGSRNIRVNALLPGGTDTPMGRTFANTPETLEYVRGLHALKRMASPDEIAQSALYLASDASTFTTGSTFLVDGGISINRS